MPSTSAPEKQAGCLACVETLLDAFAHHPGFEQRTACGMCLDAGSVANAQKPGHQADIQKIQLRALDKPLAEVAVVGRRSRHQAAGLRRGGQFASGCQFIGRQWQKRDAPDTTGQRLRDARNQVELG